MKSDDIFNVQFWRSKAFIKFLKYLAWWLSWLERRPVTAEVVGSNPIRVALQFNIVINYLYDMGS